MPSFTIRDAMIHVITERLQMYNRVGGDPRIHSLTLLHWAIKVHRCLTGSVSKWKWDPLWDEIVEKGDVIKDAVEESGLSIRECKGTDRFIRSQRSSTTDGSDVKDMIWATTRDDIVRI